MIARLMWRSLPLSWLVCGEMMVEIFQGRSLACWMERKGVVASERAHYAVFEARDHSFHLPHSHHPVLAVVGGSSLPYYRA